MDFNNSYLSPNTELIFWLIKDKPKVNKKDSFFKSEIWRIEPSKNNSHPAPFPTQLCENCIKLSTNENDLILDPFCGSGSTGVACKKTNRDFIGIELDEKYFNMAKQRIENGFIQEEITEEKLKEFPLFSD